MHRWTFHEPWTSEAFQAFGQYVDKLTFQHRGVIFNRTTVTPTRIEVDGKGASAGSPMIIDKKASEGSCDVTKKTHKVLVTAILHAARNYNRSATFTPPDEATSKEGMKLLRFSRGELELEDLMEMS